VPFAQAAVSGLLGAFALVSAWMTWQQLTSWRLFWLILGGFTFFSWLWILRRWQAWIDADHGVQAVPDAVENPARTYQLNVTWEGGSAGDYMDLGGVDFERFAQWCAGVADGRSLGENHWTGSRGIFSKGEYHIMRDQLEKFGIVRANGRHHASGYSLTSKGRAVTREIARRYKALQVGDSPPGAERLQRFRGLLK
jgi:hypothetical protein